MLLPLIILFASAFRLIPAKSSSCRCLSTDNAGCWPSSAEFTTLQNKLSQPLLSPTPLAEACYSSASASGNCTEVQESWYDGNWRSTQPGQMQAPNWETYIFPNHTISSCPMNVSLGIPCQQGSVPASGVDARCPEDVRSAVAFARDHNLRLVIKNTGHDYLGRSTARGGFLLWTHNMKNTTYNETFIPSGAPSHISLSNILTLGAGVQWHEAYDAAYAQNRIVVGGLSAGGSVGAAGGWIQGGGHSALSPTYGLGVDNAVQMTVVTSTGSYLTVNAYQHPDLFWALRGGGGGTYGVVTSVSYQTHPMTPVVAGFFAASINATNTTAASPTLTKLFTEFVRLTPMMADGGWAGYAATTASSPGGPQAFSFVYIAVNASWAAANSSIDPFFSFAQNLAENSSLASGGALNITTAFTTQFDSFEVWEKLLFRNGTQVGTNEEIGSRLLPRDLIEHNHEAVANTILSFPGSLCHLVAGGAVARADPDSSGLNPAWRKALVHVVSGGGWPDGASYEVIEAIKQQIKQGVRTIEKLAPDSGAYFNEASLYELDPRKTFFGSHYDRLLSIKEKYDPSSLFVVAEGVGSDEWDADLNCRL